MAGSSEQSAQGASSAPDFALISVKRRLSQYAKCADNLRDEYTSFLCMMQAQGMGGIPLKYNGMFDVIGKTLKHEGIRGMYKGLCPNLMKIAPAAGISWFVFEESKRFLNATP